MCSAILISFYRQCGAVQNKFIQLSIISSSGDQSSNIRITAQFGLCVASKDGMTQGNWDTLSYLLVSTWPNMTGVKAGRQDARVEN